MPSRARTTCVNPSSLPRRDCAVARTGEAGDRKRSMLTRRNFMTRTAGATATAIYLGGGGASAQPDSPVFGTWLRTFIGGAPIEQAGIVEWERRRLSVAAAAQRLPRPGIGRRVKGFAHRQHTGMRSRSPIRSNLSMTARNTVLALSSPPRSASSCADSAARSRSPAATKAMPCSNNSFVPGPSGSPFIPPTRSDRSFAAHEGRHPHHDRTPAYSGR